MPKVIQLLVVPPPSDRYDAELVALLDDGTAQVCQYHRATLKWNPLPLPGDVTPTPWTKIIGAMPDLPDPGEEARGEARIYPCADCGLMRSKAEGGTTFTVCDGCWDKRYKKREAKSPAQAATEVTHDMARTALIQPVRVDIIGRYIDQQGRRDAEARAVSLDLENVQTELDQVERERDQWKAVAEKKRAEEPAWAKLDEVARQLAAAQAAPRVEGGLRAGSDAHVALWDAINAVVLASGGSDSNTSVARQRAVVGVETALRVLVAAEARASALPPGADEALREWRAMTADQRADVGRDLDIRAMDLEELRPEWKDMASWRRIAARLLRALAEPKEG